MSKININVKKIQKGLSSPLINVPKHENVEDKMNWLIAEMKKRKNKLDK